MAAKDHEFFYKFDKKFVSTKSQYLLMDESY